MNNNEGRINALREVLEIMKNETNIFFTNFNNLHYKAAAMIAFHGAIIAFALKIESINISFPIMSKVEWIETIIDVLLFFVILGLSVSSIITFLAVLKSAKKARIVAEEISDEILRKNEEEILEMEIKALRSNIKENQKLLNRKHKLFDAGVILSIIQISFIALNIIVNVIKI